MDVQDREMVIHCISEALRIAETGEEGMLAYLLDLPLEEAQRIGGSTATRVTLAAPSK